MRLIDADTLCGILNKIPAGGFENKNGQTYVLVTLSQVYEIIKKQPTVEPQWIPVTEQFSEDGVNVLACYEFRGNRYIDIEYYDTNDGKWYDREGVSHDDVIAWMPLPEPARMDGE